MNHKEHISVLEKNIRELRSEADLEYEKIGKASLESGKPRADLPMTELSKETREEIQGLATRAADLESAQELHRTTINEIRRSMEKLKALNSEISELERTSAGIVEQNQSLYEPIGEIAFNAYLNNPGKFGRYADKFKELTSLHERLVLLDQKEAESDQDRGKSNPLQTFIRRGIAVADQLKRSGTLKRLRTELTRLGEIILEIDFIEDAKSPELLEAAGPALKNMERLRALQKDSQGVQAEIDAVNGFLAGVKKETNAGNPEKSIHIIEHKIDLAGQSLSQTHCAIGNLLAGSDVFAKDKELSSYFSHLKDIETQIESLKNTLAEHKAAIEWQEAEKRIGQLERDAASAQRIIEQKQAELEKIAKERGTLKKVQADAAKRAGDKLQP